MKLQCTTHKVIGSAGTGKTSYLLADMREMLNVGGAEPERMGFISFSNQAVTTMSERLGKDKAQFTWFQTIHSLCNRLSPTRHKVLDEIDLKKLAKGWNLPEMCATEYSLLRVRKENPEERDYTHRRYPKGFRTHITTFIEHVGNHKRATKSIDFQDMIEVFIKEGVVPELDILYVDEAQDLSLDQWTVVRILSSRANRCVVAGDFNQAIFTFAGAKAEHFRFLEADTEITLPMTYRFGADIHDLAMTLLRRNDSVVPYAPNPNVTSCVALADSLEDALEVVQPGTDVLMLARNNYHLDTAVFESLIPAHIHPEMSSDMAQPASRFVMYIYQLALFYESAKSKPLKPRELKSLEARLHFPLATCYNKVMTWQQAFKDVRPDTFTLVEQLMHAKTSKRRLRVSSIHAAKGDEADTVILLPALFAEQSKQFNLGDEGELLTLYVAITRAKSNLILVQDGTTRKKYPWKDLISEAQNV